MANRLRELNAPNRETVLVAPNEITAYQLLKSYGDYVGKCFQSGTPLCGSSGDGG